MRQGDGGQISLHHQQKTHRAGFNGFVAAQRQAILLALANQSHVLKYTYRS